jgi:hypothetical protein
VAILSGWVDVDRISNMYVPRDPRIVETLEAECRDTRRLLYHRELCAAKTHQHGQQLDLQRLRRCAFARRTNSLFLERHPSLRRLRQLLVLESGCLPRLVQQFVVQKSGYDEQLLEPLAPIRVRLVGLRVVEELSPPCALLRLETPFLVSRCVALRVLVRLRVKPTAPIPPAALCLLRLGEQRNVARHSSPESGEWRHRRRREWTPSHECRLVNSERRDSGI